MISTVDPQTRHAHKTRARHQDGYKAHVKVEKDTGLITGCALTPAAGPQHSDAAVGIELLADEPDPIQVLGDSAYGTGELLAAAPRAGTRRSSNRGRCARPWTAGSPSTISPSTRRPPR